MKFRYYLVLTDLGECVGTDDSVKAAQYTEDETVFVIDAEVGKLLLPGEDLDIDEAEDVEGEEESDEDKV